MSELKAVPAFTKYEKFIIAMLAFLQFTIILDFMMLSPLGAILMPALNIKPEQFGVVVSVYAFSAGITGLLTAGFADKFDRKKLLLFFYVGFLVGTLLCAVAQTYHFLLFARMVTGIFGGVIGSTVFAIVTDLFPFEKRGRVMGFIQTAFSASQILGIPFGLYISNKWGWHSPFMMIVILGAFAGLLIFAKLKPIDAHLHLKSDKNPLTHFIGTLTNGRYLRAFGATALLATGGFMLMPFGSAFSVHNLGITLEQLPIVYMITGFCAMFTGPLVGRLSDSLGKFKTFVLGTCISIPMVVIYTNLGVTSITWVIVVNAVMFVGIFSRMIPSQALFSAVPFPASRGAFMAVSSSIQQISGGFASMIAGLIVAEAPDGKILHFDILGYIIVGTTLITLLQMYLINREISRGLPVQDRV